MRRGFTLIEVIVVFGIVATLGGLVSLNLLGAQRGASLNSTSEIFLADLAHTRLRALSGYGATVSGSAHGIHLDQNQYVIFTGNSYQPSDPANTVFVLPPNIAITSIGFSGGDIVFESGNGEIVSYNPSADSFVITEINSNTQRTIELNAVGTVVAN